MELGPVERPVEAATKAVNVAQKAWASYGLGWALMLAQFYAYVNVQMVGFSDKVALFYILLPSLMFLQCKSALEDFQQLKLWRIAFHGAVGFLVTWILVLVVLGYGLGVQFADIQIDMIWAALVTQLLFVAPAEEIAFRFIAPRYISERFPKRSKTLQLLAVLVIAQGSFAVFHMGAYQGSIGSLLIAWMMGCVWYLASIWKPFGKEPLGIGFTIGSHAAYNLTVLGVLAGASHWITIG